MKTRQLILLAVLTMAGLGTPLAYADNATATPGTPTAQDSKNQQNNPAGPTAQNTGTDPKKDSKKDGTMSAPSSTSTTISGAPAASKTPQKNAEASNQ